MSSGVSRLTYRGFRVKNNKIRMGVDGRKTVNVRFILQILF